MTSNAMIGVLPLSCVTFVSWLCSWLAGRVVARLASERGGGLPFVEVRVCASIWYLARPVGQWYSCGEVKV